MEQKRKSRIPAKAAIMKDFRDRNGKNYTTFEVVVPNPKKTGWAGKLDVMCYIFGAKCFVMLRSSSPSTLAHFFRELADEIDAEEFKEAYQRAAYTSAKYQDPQ